MGSKLVRRGLLFASAAIGSEILWHLYVYFRRMRESRRVKGAEGVDEQENEAMRALNARKPPTIWNTALFFPDLTSGESSAEDSPTVQLISYIEGAKMCLKICVFLASLPAFQRVVIKKKKEGLCIQVITDWDTLKDHNFSCKEFRRKGEATLKTPALRRNAHYIYLSFLTFRYSGPCQEYGTSYAQ
jgi:hypothetical protein